MPPQLLLTADRLATEVLRRLRNGWVAVSDAAPHLAAAARAGVVVTCITQAQRLGLWVLDDGMPHVGAPPHAGRVTSMRGRIHWAVSLVPRHPDLLADPVENVLGLVAVCQPFESALAVWESALQKELVQREALERLDLGPAARRLLATARPFADSGLETIVVPRLLWLRLRLPLRRQIWIHGHRVDLLIEDRLVLQIDGGHHVGRQREADIAHDAALVLLGYHVIRVGYGQIVDRWHEVQDDIMRAVARGLHRVRG
jgi:very-short-patch-repair endonuclease